MIQTAKAEISEEEIIITKTVKIKESQGVPGTVEILDSQLNFEGKISVDGSVSINWNKVNGKNLKPAFVSKFETSAQLLRNGTRAIIVGDFEKLIKKLEEIEAENGEEGSEGLLEDDELSGYEGKDASDAGVASSKTGSSATGNSNGSNTEESQNENESESDNQNETDNTPIITYEICESEITDSTVNVRQREISTFPDGEIKRGECKTKESYSIVETKDGCSIRHDYGSGSSYEQKRKIYYDSKGVMNEISGCVDTSESYAHLKMVADCEPYFDEGSGQAYAQKKTYIIKGSGELNFISSCTIDANDIKTFGPENYLREYSGNERIDRDNGVAYKRYRNYIEIGDKKVYVSGYEDDLGSAMPIVKDYEQCKYYNDMTEERSYKQYAEVYYKDGSRKVVSDCKPDQSISFAHITDHRFCEPKVSQNKLYRTVRTYFIDQTQDMVALTDCSMTDYELVIENEDIGKNFNVCDPRIDLMNDMVYGWYRKEITVGNVTEFISNCIEDPNKQYAIQQSESGCSDLVDSEKGMAVQRKRKFYDTGYRKVYITDCKETENTFNFVTSSKECQGEISADGDHYIEFEETYYRDFTGTKQIVSPCQANGNLNPIPPEDVMKDFEMCEVDVDVAQGKVFQMYKEYVKLNGLKVMLSECKRETERYYEIYSTTEGCKVRTDMENQQAIQQERKYYNDGMENIFINSCLDSDLTYAFQKSTNNCEEKLTLDSKSIVTYEETFYINGNGEKKIVTECSPNGQERLITAADIIKNYEVCKDKPDFEKNKVYSQFASYVKLNGKEVQIKECLVDYDAKSYDIELDYENCSDKMNFIDMKAIVTAERYYRKGKEDVYVTDCIETDKSYAIYANQVDCPKIPIVDSDPPRYIFQQSLHYINDTGEVVEAKECYPTPNQGIVTERYCSPTFVHDFVAKVSYYNTKYAYDDIEGKEVIVKPCMFTTTKPMFPHYDAHCGYEHDDGARISYYLQETYFTDDYGQKHVLSGCARTGQTYNQSAGATWSTGWNNAGSTGNPGGCSSTLYYVFNTNMAGPHRDYLFSLYDDTYQNWHRVDGSSYSNHIHRDCVWRETAYCYFLDWAHLPEHWRRLKNCSGGIPCTWKARCGACTDWSQY